MQLALSLPVAHLQSSAPSPAVLHVAFVVLSVFSALCSSPDHSLLATSVSWGLLWIFSSLRIGLWHGRDNVLRRRFSWTAGALLALAQVCEQAANDEEGFWWTKSLLPATLYIIRASDVIACTFPFANLDDPSNPQGSRALLPHGFVALLTVSAAVALSAVPILPQVTALGLCSVVLTSFALLLLEHAITTIRDPKASLSNGVSPVLPVRPRSGSIVRSDAWLVTMREAASIMSVACFVLSFCFEKSYRMHTVAHNSEAETVLQMWESAARAFAFQQAVRMALTGAVANLVLFLMIRQAGAFDTICSSLAGLLFAHAYAFPSLQAFWFALLYGAGALSLNYHAPGRDSKMLARHFLTIVAAISFGFILFSYLRQLTTFSQPTPPEVHGSIHLDDAPESSKPLALSAKDRHPVEQLIADAEKNWDNLLSRQSQTLEDAVARYRQKFGTHPPPQFDRWFEFAKRKGVQLIDDGYDEIHRALTPFWALKPATIRARVREALGHGDNSLIGLLIRDGQATHIEGGQEWQQEATLGMIKSFIAHLPDMDVAFNIHDEPRVVVPHDQLSRLIARAKGEKMPAALATTQPKNQFSKRPKDMNNGKRIDEVSFTRFNQFAHQGTWTHSRLSCSPDSPARSIDENPPDNQTAYAVSELGFIYNTTAFSDICNSPSLSSHYGFFDRPNAFNLVQELFPIFSQSKISSYQDILYPSPWYWYGKVPYEEFRDPAWEDKADALYWRGSTTGGFSRASGWRRQHRQHVVARLNEPGKALIMRKTTESVPASSNADDASSPGVEEQTVWAPKAASRKDYASLFDVRFSHIGQCDPGDCDAQREFFKLADAADQQDAWGWKHLLDMDGNAFSGRFYAFLQSKSLVYKMALFREWHGDWLQPWLHYVPLSLRGDEWLEVVRFFQGEEEGKRLARFVAARGREWAAKTLRNVDFEVWFFRLLLEYGRLIDDNRETIGYAAT
ncbi:uncharacterized protein J3D65DRAFT_638496 [Phyllosticta citribraziliensis]|uniref:Glycosyl transferase CAP10 domain-containing protein n=1 Tax=Phyllosticta citribraziliensis TaxID=989973 RepID=A0ABR1L906_9PEZI